MTGPIYLFDQPAKQDLFGRTSFADALSHSIVLPANSPGLIVGIEGAWGSGKSSILQFILQRIEHVEQDAIVVKFNPWMVSTTGGLVEALIGQIAASIGAKLAYGEAGVKLGQKMLDYIGLLRHLRHMKYAPSLALSSIGMSADIVSAIAQNLAEASDAGTDAGQKGLEDIKKVLPTLDLTGKKDAVIKALTEINRPIIVVVDDLDRLPGAEIRTMMQALKAVGDFPRVTYLLAYDRRIVANALGNSEEEGMAYLEKIVQVAYPIPPLFQHQLRKFVETKVHELFERFNVSLLQFEAERLPEAVALIAQLSRQPRDVIRTINRLTLSLPATRGEVNVADVMVFESMSQRFPMLREAIHRHPSDFIGYSFRGDEMSRYDDLDWSSFVKGQRDGEREVAWANYVGADPASIKIAERACKFLFPGDKERSIRKFEDHLRIADPDRLARLFRLTSLDDVPEAKTVHAMLQHPERLVDWLDCTRPDEVMNNLEWIENYLPSCESMNAEDVIHTLIALKLDATDKEDKHVHIVKQLGVVLERLLENIATGRAETFLFIVSAAPIAIAEKIVLRAAQDLGKWPIRPSERHPSEHLIQSGEVVDDAIRVWCDRVRRQIEDKSLFNEPNIASILHRFGQLQGSYTEVYAALSEFGQSECVLAAFLQTFGPEPAPREITEFSLVEDPEILASRINASPYRDTYKWLVRFLSDDENAKAIRAQSSRLKNSPR